MKPILLSILLALAPLTLCAQTAFDDAFAELDAVLSDGADMDRILETLTRIVQTSRALGRSEPDFAIFYAMLADQLRNEELNPVYALQIAEEGLELIAGDPNQQDFAAILRVTRAYALADLGRLEEAYSQALLILPIYETVTNPETAADFRKDAEKWGKGQLSDFNTAATELAREPLKQAYAALDDRTFGKVLTLASAALLPMGTGLDEGDVRAINSEAEILIAKALGALGRTAQSGNAWLRALGYMTQSPWTLDGAPDWWGQGPADPVFRMLAFDIFTGLAGTAGLLNRTDIEQAALTQAADLAGSASERFTVLIRQARLALSQDDAAQTHALLSAARDTAQQSGNVLDQQTAEFYLAILQAREGIYAGQIIDADPVVAATEAILETYRAHLTPDEDFLFSQAARVLVYSDDMSRGLDYARRALNGLRGKLSARKDTGFGQEQARRNARSEVEFFLKTAHVAASIGLDDRLLAPGCEDPRDHIGCTVVGP